MNIIHLLLQGMIAIIPTDTIYGIVGSALNLKTVEKIYKLRKRSSDKPMIILISSIDDLGKFQVQLTDKQREILQKIWPNTISIILPCSSEKFQYLHRGKNSLAFRMPKNEFLLEVLKKVGPLVAPSANFEGGKPAETIDEAKKYFGESVLYMDGRRLVSKPSTLVEFDESEIKILREGAISKMEITKLLE